MTSGIVGRYSDHSATTNAWLYVFIIYGNLFLASLIFLTNLLEVTTSQIVATNMEQVLQIMMVYSVS